MMNPRQKYRSKGFGFNRATMFMLLVIGLSTGVGLVIGELILRGLGSHDTWAERNKGSYHSPYKQKFKHPWCKDNGKNKVYSFNQPEFDFEVRTNSEGVRDIEHPVEKPAHEYRIIALGDSFTMGQGAPFEATWPKVLERRLNGRSSGRRIRVIMCGATGSDPVFQLEMLKRRLLKYRPDLVIQCVNDSDVCDIITRGGLDRFTAEGYVKKRAMPRLEWLWARSHLFRAIMMDVLGYNWFLISPWEWPARERKAVEEILDVARAVKGLGRGHGFDYLMVAHPFYHHITRADSRYGMKALGPLTSSEGIDYVDLLPLFLKKIGRDPERIWDYYWKLDHHCKPLGYELLAEGVEDKIRHMGYLKKP